MDEYAMSTAKGEGRRAVGAKYIYILSSVGNTVVRRIMYSQ